MSYKHPYTRQFYSDEFHVVFVPTLRTSPERCPEHRDPDIGKSRGFLAVSSPGLFRHDAGRWRLVAPLDIATEMPGVNKKLTHLSIKGMHVIGWGTINPFYEGKIGIEADGSGVLPETLIGSTEGSWNINELSLNIALDGYSKLDIRLWQAAGVFSGYMGFHNADVILSGEYYTDIPPATADVDVTTLNRATGQPIKNTYVSLMSGAVVVAEGYTDGYGKVLFTNIDEGTYTLKAIASGYQDAEQSIDVMPPKVAYILKLAPIPGAPLPWWLIPSAVGLIAVGAIVVLRKPSLPIMVVK